MGQEKPREIPGLDSAGIISRKDLEQRARDVSRDAFAATYKAPALVLSPATATEAEAKPPTSGGAVQILTITSSASRSNEAVKYTDRVAFITKRPGNPFPHMVSLGRVATNDVVVQLETVSKLHGYFIKDGDRWLYTDYRSTNGTVVNGLVVEKGAKVPLKDGDRLRIGSELEATFYGPAALHDVLTGRAS